MDVVHKCGAVANGDGPTTSNTCFGGFDDIYVAQLDKYFKILHILFDGLSGFGRHIPNTFLPKV
jgi:hypothetical protein